MNNFLNEYITSLSGKRQAKVFDVLRGARVAKEDLDSLATKLVNVRKEAPIVIAPESFGGLIQANKFDATYRDVYRRVLELYEGSNLISLLLDTHNSTLISEIKAIEDELFAMEKAIDNYAFMLSDNGFYNYAYTETFNDDTMRETNTNIKLTDRSGLDFLPDEQALVNGTSGVLTLNPVLQFSYPLVGTVVDSNCLALTTSDTGLDNSLNSSVSNGWRIAISSPKPFSSSLVNVTEQGAQITLELLLVAAAPCDSIVLVPFSDIAMQIVSIKVISGADTNAIEILNETTLLDRPQTFGFPLQSVSKFRITVNQSVYSRGELPPVKEQSVYRDFYSSVTDERKQVEQYTGREYNKNRKALKRVFIASRRRFDKDFTVFKAEVPHIDFEPTRGPMTIDKIVRRPNDFGNKNDMWQYQSKAHTFMRRMINDSLFSSNMEVLNDRQTYNVGSSFSRSSINGSYNMSPQGFPRIVGVEAPLNANILSAAVLEEKQYLDYQYNLGLRNIQIGAGEQVYRGIFITKPIPAPSGTGEIKLKTDETNYEITDIARDSTVITSIEYSVSNKSTPTTEEDWIPVLSIDTEDVVAERVFFNDAATAVLRFNADPSGRLVLYKNGKQYPPQQITLVKNNDGNAIRAIRIQLGTYAGTDMFTIDYTPYGDQSVINFDSKGYSQTLLASAYDDQGAGETFDSTYNNQIITLTNDPYVSYTDVNTSGVYSVALGFTGSYQPITIVMSDGTIALNQTNYLGATQNNLSTFDETQTAYIHSGKNIIFNKPIDSKFTVYYQYIPSNLRLRMIMRVNDTNYVSPILSSIQIKAKTLKADARKIL